MSPGVDGSIVLRYHSVPSLRARPPIPLETAIRGRGSGSIHRLETASRYPLRVDLEMSRPFRSAMTVRAVETGTRGEIAAWARMNSRPAWLSPGRVYAMLEIDSATAMSHVSVGSRTIGLLVPLGR